MRVTLKIVNYERIIANYRYAKFILSDFTEEMALFLDLFKSAVGLRILNDGEDPRIRSEEQGALLYYAVLKDGYIGYKYQLSTMRRVIDVGGGFKRSTKSIRWKPLAETTLMDRMAEGYQYPYFPRLFRTGELLKSVAGFGIGHYEHITKTGFRVGAENPVAAFHQFGTKKIPARPFFFLSNDLYFLYRKILKLKFLSVFRMMRSKAKTF